MLNKTIRCNYLSKPLYKMDCVNENFTYFAEFREAFQLFDKDGDGRISSSEVGQVLHSIGVMVEAREIDEMVDEIDEDGE